MRWWENSVKNINNLKKKRRDNSKIVKNTFTTIPQNYVLGQNGNELGKQCPSAIEDNTCHYRMFQFQNFFISLEWCHSSVTVSKNIYTNLRNESIIHWLRNFSSCTTNIPRLLRLFNFNRYQLDQFEQLILLCKIV